MASANDVDAGALTLGIEEEFHVVDLRTRGASTRAPELLERLSSSPRGYAAELQRTVIETNSEVATSLESLLRILGEQRRELVDAAQALGLGVAAAGTMPISMAEIAMTENSRFRRMRADYQMLVREQLICGMQVHVGLKDRDLAAILLDRLARYLPALLALSVSSPFSHAGEDTGYASSRSLIWARWPTSGSPGPLHSRAEYDALVQNLIGAGVISDPGMIYFDVRPSAHVPTIEFRLCDACHSIETVVLIAGLFRAAVARELSLHAAGTAPPAIDPALRRAALWRAARSGLEGELVDLSAVKSMPAAVESMPAAVVVRNLLDELSPELEASGDAHLVRELCDLAIARRSAADRQREALRRRERMSDVVDLILAETRGEKHAPTERAATIGLAHGYHPPGFDEALGPDGQARPSHAGVLAALSALGARELERRAERLLADTRAAGVLFRPTDAKEARPFPLDLVPRVLRGEEWSRVQGGSMQRARALDAFLDDIYGERAIVRDGIVPAWLVDTAPGRREAGHAPRPGTRRVHVAGFDIVRDGDGRWLVLEDNVRVPSGVGYAMQSRRLVAGVLPELASVATPLDVEGAPPLLRKTLEESAPPNFTASLPAISLLSEGPHDSAYFEHQMLATAMQVPLSVPAQLLVENDRLYRTDAGALEPIDVLYLRMDDSLFRRRGADGAILGPELLRAVKAGNLALGNALGNGVADDKAIYDYVPRFIEYYLGERPLFDQVPTYHCADPEQQRLVLSRLEELVVKPVDGYGGLGVVVGPHASDSELADARAIIEEQPERWIAQETVALSTHPTFHRGQLEPRHVDLRVFVYYGSAPLVVPAALTRVAAAGTMIVNSSRGGGAKDTWLLG